MVPVRLPDANDETGTEEAVPDRSPSPEDLLLAKELSLQITELFKPCLKIRQWL